MNKEKQIEEMAKQLYGNFGLTMPTARNVAKYLIEKKGYRKADEVAREIFEEIEHTAKAAIILLKFEKNEKIRNSKIECYADLIGYIAELKKKYTQEK